MNLFIDPSYGLKSAPTVLLVDGHFVTAVSVRNLKPVSQTHKICEWIILKTKYILSFRIDI